MSTVTPFRIEVSDDVLDDLAQRLDRARHAGPPIVHPGETAETSGRIEELVRYWRDGYDWRAAERRLNAYPQFRVVVDGVAIHFVHVPGPDGALPLLLINGWPSSFVEYLDVVAPLTDQGFSVVIPTLPGFGFSDRCLDRDVSEAMIAELFHRLMVDELGYREYVAHGDDFGGGVVNELGIRHPEAVLALQTLSWHPPYLDGASLSETERTYRAEQATRRREYGAYSQLQATRPQTLAYGLNDSPLGLAAWILEKFLTWSDPSTRDHLSADDLLTNVTLYWATQTIGSSMRLYGAPYGPFGPQDVVKSPSTVLVPHQPNLVVPPESWIRRAYTHLDRYSRPERGGHFLALEAPDVFVAEIRRSFAPRRATVP